MSDTQIILEAIEKHKENLNAKIDALRAEGNENHRKLSAEMNNKFTDTNKCINSIQKELSITNVHLQKSQEDIKEFEDMLQGNGAPGLKLKVELLDRELEQIKALREKEESEQKQSVLLDKKSKTSIKIAIITTVVGGIVSLITLLVTYL